jgi:RecA/RadA recombinase
MERTKVSEPLSTQLKRKVSSPSKVKKKELDGDFGTVISTGSTLLDLAISGGRIRGGGLPGGILVEAFGPSGSGKTVLLSEIAGAVQRQDGEVVFYDPEARLNKQFARMFGLDIRDENYFKPDTVTEVFTKVRKWKPEIPNRKKQPVHGIFADSLAALSTDLEMEKDEGDKMGMRRPKEFSEQLRRTCRIIEKKNYLMVCSNQIRTNTSGYGTEWNTPGGLAIGFYSSLRLQFNRPTKIKLEKNIAGKKRFRIIGVEVNIDVAKSSIWKPFHSAPVTIIFDYGIDDIRQNLQFIKDYTSSKVYTLDGQHLSNEIIKAIRTVEKNDLEEQLKEEVINLWEEIELKFTQTRKPKR